MNKPTSPLLTSLNQTLETLDAKARLCSENVAVLQKRKADNHGSADDSESNLAMVLAGGDVTIFPDFDAQITTTMKKWKVIADAQDITQRKIGHERFKVNVAYCTEVKKPEFDRLMKKLCGLLIDTNSVHTELFAMKRTLIDTGIGLLAGVYDINPESFLSTPSNRYSDFADFLRDAKRLGYISAVPKDLR